VLYAAGPGIRSCDTEDRCGDAPKDIDGSPVTDVLCASEMLYEPGPGDVPNLSLFCSTRRDPNEYAGAIGFVS
jgi:hypothetical protein